MNGTSPAEDSKVSPKKVVSELVDKLRTWYFEILEGIDLTENPFLILGCAEIDFDWFEVCQIDSILALSRPAMCVANSWSSIWVNNLADFDTETKDETIEIW